MSDTKKTYERSEIQAALEPVVENALAALGLADAAQDMDHARRTIRSLLRLAAKRAVARGCPPGAFMHMAMESLVKEAGGTEIKSPEDLAAVLAAKANGGQSN